MRRCLVEDLARAGVRPEVVDDAALLASELVGNAVRHAHPLPGGVLRVTWSVDATRVLVTVTDGGGREAPHVRSAGPCDVRGRGLAIVESLARDWGVHREDDSVSTVWAELPAR